MGKRKNNRPGFTRQGIRDLSYLKGKSIGRRLELPPDQATQCDHHGTVHEVNAVDGISQCSNCKIQFGFDGCAI